ncbi:MAG: Lrp/AsnC family transcriptional regulator [Gammaproteobacteria bacterium]|nr:Lrp/AsnC family transcriptional regulator [Gammaproteobacteria bacterium]
MLLDPTDRRILAELQRDGRLSHVELAERVGLTPTPCTRRVRELEAAGVIQGYAALVEPRKVGLAIQAIVQVKLEKHTDEIVARFRQALQERPEVLACLALTGDMDFLLQVVVRDVDALSDFTLRRLLRLPGVRDVRTGLVLETVKRSTVVPVDDAPG